MWSVVEKTALAEAEVEYEDYVSDQVWVKFPVRMSAADTSETNRKLASAAILIWTTTPWTIPGNRAISFSRKIEYGLYEVLDAPSGNWAKPGDRFVLADKLAARRLPAGARHRVQETGLGFRGRPRSHILRASAQGLCG